MPRENRKRGKKSKNHRQEHPAEDVVEEHVGEPSWIVAPSKKKDNESEEPFGPLDVDVKAYFRNVDLKIRDWQENLDESAGEGEEGVDDPNEKKRMFFMAALTEMHSKEKEIATDPECSVILERMLYSMDDFVRRVFIDSLVGSYGILIRHRFASHVCQTLFTVARDTVIRERKGIMPDLVISPEEGELRTLTRLVLDVCEEVLLDVASLVTHPFASHVIRSLLLLLSPSLAASEDTQSTVRSKKSATWKSKQGQMKSVFDDVKGKEEKESVSNPDFQEMARRFVEAIKKELDENEVRAMAADKVACPTLKMLMEVEAEQNMANESGSLMDRVTVGVITACQKNNDVSESDYLGTLIRDPNASHLLETVISRCPPEAFDAIWKTYFEGKLARLSVHPVANFVVAKALDRVSEPQLTTVLEELEGTWKTLIQMARTGVMRAVMDRVLVLKASGLQTIPEIVLAAFKCQKSDDKKLLVPCILSVQPLKEYQTALKNITVEDPQPVKQHGRKTQSKAPGALEPKIQGSLLLQSLLRLPEPLNHFVIDGVLEMPIQERVKIAHNACGSRIFDIFLDSPTVSSNKKRQLVMDFIGHYDRLVDDKFGSRVGDRCWVFSDTYLKEKIARSLISKEHELAASFYGKFFAKNLNLYLLQRRPDEWRNLQSARRQQGKCPTAVLTEPGKPSLPEVSRSPTANKRKRKNEEDIIDVLFNSERLGKKNVKKKKVTLADDQPPSAALKTTKGVGGNRDVDKELELVFGAIRSAPETASHPKKKKR